MGWREEAALLPNFSPSEFALDAATTGLIVVDMQYVDAHREYGLGVHLKENFPEVWDYYFTRVEESVIPNCRRALGAFREYGMRVIHLTVGPVLADGMDMVRLRRPKVAEGLLPMLHHAGTFEHQILPELAPIEGEVVINKTSRGAFNSTAIERVLLNLGLESLIVVGVSTSSCVETTARDAADRGFNVVIVEDGTAEMDEPSHDATLRQFAVRWGRVWTTDETLGHLRDLQSQAAIGTSAQRAAAVGVR
jgi:nicotinamidase-related amidase